MSAVWLFLVSLAVFGTLFYNFGIKLAGDVINPFVFTVLMTFTALAGHVAAFGVNKAFFNSDLKFSFGTTGVFYAVVAGIGIVIIDLAYFYAVKEGGLAVTNAFWVVGALVATVLMSYFFFSESINTMKAIGIILGIFSIVLISRS